MNLTFARAVSMWLLLVAGGAAWPQAATSPNDGPFRTVSDGADDRLMLLGYDAVAYFTDHAAVKGDPAIKLEHQGVTYRFASEAHKAEFARSPEKYMPQFGGFCVAGGRPQTCPWLSACPGRGRCGADSRG